MTDMPQGERTVDDFEIIKYMSEDSAPAYTTSELADVFDMTTEGMRGRLEKLKDSGEIRKKKPSSRTVMWWHESAENAQAFSA